MKQTLKIFLAMAITLTLTVAFAPVNVSAVEGGKPSFNCFLIVDATETIPDVTFIYTIAPGTEVAADSTATPPTT